MSSLAELGEISKARFLPKFKLPGVPGASSRATRKAARKETKRLAREAGVPAFAYRQGQGLAAGAAQQAEQALQSPGVRTQASQLGRTFGAEAGNEVSGRLEAAAPKIGATAGTAGAAAARETADQAVTDIRSQLPSKRKMAAYGIGGGAAVGTAAAAPGAAIRYQERQGAKPPEQRDRLHQFLADKKASNRRQQAFNSMNQPQMDMSTVGNRPKQRVV